MDGVMFRVMDMDIVRIKHLDRSVAPGSTNYLSWQIQSVRSSLVGPEHHNENDRLNKWKRHKWTTYIHNAVVF